MSLINFSSSFSIALCFSFLFLFSTATAFNITEILSQHGDFSNFNNLLTQTKVAEQINSRQTITVLAVANGNLPSGQSNDAIKNALMLHVILDYYDVQKLKNLKSKTALFTTLFQASGNARGQQGFLNVTVTDNEVAFGSAVQESSLDAKVIGPVTSEPYNISVLQVSTLINPGAAAANSNSTASPTNSPAPASSPAKSPAPASSPAKSPAPAASSNSSTPPQASSPKSSPSPSASKAPAPSTSQPPANSPSSNGTTGTAPAASSPTDSGAAPSPEDSASTPSSSPSDSPVTSPPAASESPVADGPASDTPSTNAPSSESSGVPPAAINAGIGIASFLMVLSSAAWVLA